MKIDPLPQNIPARRLSIIRRLATRAWRLAIPLAVVGLFLTGGAAAFGAPAADDPRALPKAAHIDAIYAEKSLRTPAQKKLDSHLLFAARKDRGEEPVPGIPTLSVGVPTDQNGRVTVEIRANINPDLLAQIEKEGGAVLHTSTHDGVIVAALPLQQLEKLGERDDVRFIQLPPIEETNFGPVDSEGDATHDAVQARLRYNVDGTGVRVGVMSNGTKSFAKSQANGELSAGAEVYFPGPADKDEGTAMMEIVQDIAPGAHIIYATGSGGPSIMADHIRTLKGADCSIIIDDISYSNESPFQDGEIAQAVNEVSAAGVLYFSSAANSGNKDSNQASTWEGDFADGGAPPAGFPSLDGKVHSFGPKNFNTNPSGRKTHVELFWNDPLGKSTNDYDLVLTDDAGNVLDMSVNIQDGTQVQDPFESIPDANSTQGMGRRGSRIYVLQKKGAKPRFIHLCTDRNPLEISTPGSTRGHNASGAANAFSVAAAPANKAFDVGNPAGPFPSPFARSANFENFSSDGPRRIFYEADGTAITPNNLTSTGGRVLQKPDITAADGVTTSVQDFAPFFGTSAAAPHAGAIAALLKQKFPAPAQIRDALMSTALDLGAAGWDRDSGAGIIMPLAAMNRLSTPPAEVALVGPAPDYSVNPNQVVQKPAIGSATSVTVNIRITAAPAAGSVHVHTQDGTATAAFPYNEYQPIDQIANFNAGDSTLTFHIGINGQPNFNGANNQNFTVFLDSAVNGTIITNHALITILDQPAPNVSLSVVDTAVIEGAPTVPVPGGSTVNAVFYIFMTPGASDHFVTVTAATSDVTAKAGIDYQATQVALTFKPGETVKTVSVPVLNTPDRNKPEQTFNLVLSNPVNAQIAKNGVCTVHQPVTPGPAINIATRMRVLTNDNVLIGGFIVTGTEPKKVIVRGIGPSLSGLLSGTLVDPVLQLFSGNTAIGSNDDWKINQNGQSQEAEIRATTIPPSNDKESAVIATLNPGAYTAILSGKNNGQGVGVVEVYDLSPRSQSELANIATRGFVDSGDNVMIGGFIVGVNTESADTRVIIRGIGPSLPIAGALKDPTLELHNGSGTLLASNDNWKVSDNGQSQEAEVRFTQIPPSKDLESAIVTNLVRGQYTAILRGKNNGTGIGLIEVYKIN